MFTQRTAILLGVLVVIAVGYVVYGAMALGWFGSEPIRITSRLEDPPRRRRTPPGSPPPVRTVVFGMDGKYHLTSIRVEEVVPPDSEQAPPGGVYVAPRTTPLWHVVADGEGPDRIQRFTYGQNIAGMKSAIEGQAGAERLRPNMPYRIIVEAGKRRAELEFQTTAVK